MILLTLCHIICWLSISSALVDPLIQSVGISVRDYFHWIHPSVASTHLYCQNCCSKDSQDSCITKQFATDQIAVCCIASALPFWYFSEFNVFPLELKFTYSEHTNLVDFHPLNKTGNYFVHEDGNLTLFPDDICKFTRVVAIFLRNNKIEKLINLRCIIFLDYLDLQYNKIKEVRASSFEGMFFLWYLGLSYNLITYLEPGAFKYRPRSLAYIDLRGNFLTTVDLSNAYLGYFFREVNYWGNQISRITNELKWTGFEQRDIIGGGWINVSGNHLTRIPPISELGFKDLNSALRGAFNYQIFLDDNPWSCDCDTYQYVYLSSYASTNFDGLQFECVSPPLLKGYTPKKFKKNPLALNYLICNISLDAKCPPKCYCYSKPSAKRVVVNCSSTDRSVMPKVVPEFDNLDIDLSYNLIRSFENLNYLIRAIRIDLSYNRITFIDAAVYGIKTLNFINLAHNQMTKLERSVQLRNPCKLWFGRITLLKCNCDMIWIKVWLEWQTTLNCKMKNVIFCQKGDQSIDLMLLRHGEICSENLSYEVYSWFAALVTLIMIISGILYYNFRFEIKLLLRTVKLYLPYDKASNNLYEYDLYVSFKMDNNNVRNWTLQSLRTFFENQGYTICIPPRDFNAGAIHVEEIYTQISKSKSFAVVLSQDYERSHFQNIEGKHIWNIFMTDSMTTITVINYDFLDSHEIIDRKLKSFLRLGYSLSFYNFHKNLMNDMKTNMGPPIHYETAVLGMNV